MTNLLTTGSIARRLNEDRDRVCYAVRKLNLKPIGQAGIAKVYDNKALKAVKDFLRKKEPPID